jgi:hypothetical protein
MHKLEAHFTALEAALAAARAAPLSRKRAMLAVLLVDAAVDARCPAGDDVLAFRAGIAATHPALRLVMEVAAMRDGGPRLLLETVAVPLADAPALGVEDFMVSVYNGSSVQRVRIGGRDVHEVLAEAVAELRRSFFPP